MHILKRISIIILCISTVVFGLYYTYGKLTTDNTLPVISCDVDEIEASVYGDEAELYDGVTAWDDKDGDITDKVFIEEISKFIRDGVSNVTYAVVDSDNHVAKITRRVIYTDYESPQFSVSSPLVFVQGQTFSMLDYISATDSIDGDISDKIKVTSSSVDTQTEGVYDISVSASNSFGDVVTATLPVYVVSSEELTIDISLSTYLVYINKGESIDPKTYIDSVADYYDKEIDKDSVEVKSKIDLNTPGVYSVEYSVEDENENKGITYLTVVVE